MSDFTRILAVGSRKRADVMVPSAEPFAMAAPWLVDLLDESRSDGGSRLVAVRADGSEVDLALTPIEQELLDGEVVRFVRTEDAPAPAEVSDVTSAVADGYARRPLAWNARARHIVAAGGLAVIAFAVASLASGAVLPDATEPALLGTAIGLAALAAGARALRILPAPLFLTAAALGVWAAAALRSLGPVLSGAEAWRLPLDDAALWVVLGLGVGVGIGIRGAAVAAVVALVPPLALAIAAAAGATPSLIAGIVAVVATALLGVVPWISVAASGLAALDDRLSASAEPARLDSFAADRTAYGVSAWTTAALAVPLGAAGVQLAATLDPWTIWLAAAVAVVAMLRTRVAPGWVEQASLWAAALAIVLAATVTWLPGAGPQIVAIVAVGVLVVVGATVRPVEHARARIRRFGTLVEWAAVVSIPPLLLGVANLYAELLETFSR